MAQVNEFGIVEYADNRHPDDIAAEAVIAAMTPEERAELGLYADEWDASADAAASVVLTTPMKWCLGICAVCVAVLVIVGIPGVIGGVL